MADFDRSRVLARRHALARSVRRDAAVAVAANAATVPALSTAARVAAYVARRGELDPSPIVRAAWSRHAAVALPVVRNRAQPSALEFASYTADTVLEPGHHGIPVPPANAPRWVLDDLDNLVVVLVPLVAFDASLTRVGSGAGYYDRTFATRRVSGTPPLLIGLAYYWQQVSEVERSAWDVPLDLVITDRGIVYPPPGNADQPR